MSFVQHSTINLEVFYISIHNFFAERMYGQSYSKQCGFYGAIALIGIMRLDSQIKH